MAFLPPIPLRFRPLGGRVPGGAGGAVVVKIAALDTKTARITSPLYLQRLPPAAQAQSGGHGLHSFSQ